MRSCDSVTRREHALDALDALPTVALADSAEWPCLCPALLSALAAPKPVCTRSAALLRRLVHAAHDAAAAQQLAQLATTLALFLSRHSCAEEALTLEVATLLSDAEAALCECWQARTCVHAAHLSLAH